MTTTSPDYEPSFNLIDASLNALKDQIISGISSSSSYIMSSNDENTINNAIALTTQLKAKNVEKWNNINEYVKDLNAQKDMVGEEESIVKRNASLDDIEKLKKIQDTNEAQNKLSMRTFLEKYLYIIVKVIFILIVFYFVFSTTPKSSSINTNIFSFASISTLFNGFKK